MMMKRSAIIVVLAIAACLAFCVENSDAIRGFNKDSKPALPPRPNWPIPTREEIEKCALAHQANKVKPCVDEFQQNIKDGKRGIDAVGPLCCAHFHETLDSCPMSSQASNYFVVLRHDIEQLQKHCPSA